jgi:argininosuccinate synthase
MRNLDIADSRSRLEQYAVQGLVGGPTAELVGALEAGGANEIADTKQVDEADRAADEALDRAAFDAGTD